DPPDDRVIAIVAFEEHVGFWREIPRDLFLRLWRLSRTGANIADPAWVKAIDECVHTMHHGRDFPFAPGAALVNLGTSWWIKDYFLRVRHVQRRHGVRYIPFLHDCIPLLVPEHCERKLVLEFAQWFAELAAHADTAFANSASTATDATRFLESVVPGMGLPISVMPLDASLREDLASAPARPAPAGAAPTAESFVLCVGTIESRKNHLMLFQAWLTLLRRHGPDRIPPLICVGKPGWLAQPAMTLLETAPELAGKVRILHGIPDLELARLYERCLFTVYNSFHEGWGLPVTESLSYSKVPVLPRHSGLAESGAQGGLFFEPQNEPDLVAKLESLIFDPVERARREAALQDGAALRSWKAIAAQLLSDPALTTGAAAIPPGERICVPAAAICPLSLSGALRPSAAMAASELVREGLFWHPLEAEGCWTRPGPSRLRIPLGPVASGRYRVHLGLRGPVAGTAIGVRAIPRAGAPGPFLRTAVAPRARVTVVVDAEAADGALQIEIEAPARRQMLRGRRVASRQVGVCVTHVMACRPEDQAARMAFLERQHFVLLEAGT
ncbi:MAG TPA: glycosyltransferase, partial [Acetobacteraceae bacterium]|nr:glycosyltransferase [Acetobacteraceae bacterium]